MFKKRPPRWRRVGGIAYGLTLKANPILFAVIMGTGAVSNLFAVFPYGTRSKGMMIASLSVYFLNLALFCTFTSFSLAKYTLYPDRWKALVDNPVASLYIGTFPMGVTTLVNVSVDVVNSYFKFGGKAFLYIVWGIWWIDVVISVLCCWVGVHAMIVRQNHSFTTMSAAWLLPVVTLIVAASTGGVMGLALQKYSPRHALITVTFSVFLVAVGLCLAFMILTLYLGRLIIHGLPPGASVLSVFLPLGPTGQSGFAWYLIGRNLHTLLPYVHAGDSGFLSSPTTADILIVLCTSSAFLMWCLATMWMLYAILALQSTVLKSPVAFKMSFWGLVFPNGVYANLTISLGNAFDSNGLRIYGAVYAVIVICLWVSIATRSLFALKELLDPNIHMYEDAKGDRKTTLLSSHPSAGTSQTEIAIECGGEFPSHFG
ncbi:sulphite efflux pump protein [Coprinellus micaceus]|uniref:Sulphite efflux pump protein n=1 Tax=Coprinellus micaceus TaxID=71717 RepID=A0A4Y7TXM5_COPMI|nr:sulphite efflux pump protein [Coprinellus micaceus]